MKENGEHSPVDWRAITPESILRAITHLREEFDRKSFWITFETQKRCFETLYPLAPGTSEPAVFKHFFYTCVGGLRTLVSSTFSQVLKVSLAQVRAHGRNPVEWAELQLQSLISDEVRQTFDMEGYANPDADPNQFSYVLHVSFGQCSIVLGGDLPESRWAKLYEYRNGKFPKVHLLKPSHHGRKSGYHRDSVKAMAPTVSVVSVGELKCKDDAESSYESFSAAGCFSTVEHGTIVATCWEDGDVWLQDENGKRLLGPKTEAFRSVAEVLGGRIG